MIFTSSLHCIIWSSFLGLAKCLQYFKIHWGKKGRYGKYNIKSDSLSMESKDSPHNVLSAQKYLQIAWNICKLEIFSIYYCIQKWKPQNNFLKIRQNTRWGDKVRFLFIFDASVQPCISICTFCSCPKACNLKIWQMVLYLMWLI